MINDVGSGTGEAHKQAQLHRNQDKRKHDPGEGNRQPGSIL
jgi:hypothetical protein